MAFKPFHWDRLALGNCFYMRLSPGFRYPKTFHRRLWEIWVVQQGEIQFGLPQKTVVVGKQCALLIPPGLPHVTRVEDPRGCLGLCAHFRTKWEGLLPVARQSLKLSARALHYLRDFLDCWGGADPTQASRDNLAECRRRATWALLLMEIAQPVSAPSSEPAQIHSLGGGFGNELAQRVLEAMLSDLSAGLSIEKLARQTGYRPRRLLNLFQKQTGLTLREALARLRLEEAKRLLRHSPFQIKAVGQMVGFPNANKFSAFFRKRAGCTPTEYTRTRLLPIEEITTRLPSPIGGDEVRVED